MCHKTKPNQTDKMQNMFSFVAEHSGFIKYFYFGWLVLCISILVELFNVKLSLLISYYIWFGLFL